MKESSVPWISSGGDLSANDESVGSRRSSQGVRGQEAATSSRTSISESLAPKIEPARAAVVGWRCSASTQIDGERHNKWGARQKLLIRDQQDDDLQRLSDDICGSDRSIAGNYIDNLHCVRRHDDHGGEETRRCGYKRRGSSGDRQAEACNSRAD